ncbi:aminotransferase class IV [Actinoplanes sp. NPDC051411]|uniref:aminotransferase class IV n=1 Tax=Actinoplanes sp. NPDC051411 TaxID=3155522 RepID=UPI0034482AAE
MSVVSVFTNGRLEPGAEPQDDLLAADSWLVDEGAVRFLGDHRTRFRAACAGLTDPGSVDRFWAAAVEALPRTGRWFPRVELSATGRLRLRVRPVPAARTSLIARFAPPGDPRSRPRLKGPDLILLSELRAAAAAQGADELLLRNADGLLLEGVTTSLVWWVDGELCVPSRGLPCLPGVTTGRIQARARELGIPLRHRRSTPDQLAGREVWLVNALHGIRPVRGWAGTDMIAGPARNAPEWQAWLTARARILPRAEAPALVPGRPGPRPGDAGNSGPHRV